MLKRSFFLLTMLFLLTGCDSPSDWHAASVAEIQAVTEESDCAKKILLEANRDGVKILRRDLIKVEDQCSAVDDQAKAFTKISN